MIFDPVDYLLHLYRKDMKTYQIKILADANQEMVTGILEDLSQKGFIEYTEEAEEEAVPASEEQVQEIIEEAELGPYYSEKEAKEILNL